MKAGAGVLIIGLFGALPAMAWQTAPNVVPGAAPTQQTATPVDTPATKPCSQAAIRTAAARKVAPQLTGCNLAVVAPPLLQFFHLIPKTAEVADSALPGTILSQTPAAGAALSPGGRLLLDISSGRPAQAPPASSSSSSAAGSAGSSASSATSSSAAASSSSSLSSVTSSSISSSAASSSSAVSEASEAVSSSPPVPVQPPEPPPPPEQPKGFPLWGWLAVAVAIVAALGAGLWLRARPPAGGAAVPDVGCHLDLGPGRMTSDGPLIDGPVVEVAMTLETGTSPEADITVLNEDPGKGAP